MVVTDEFSLRRHQNPRVYATLEPLDSDDSTKLKITSVLREITDSLIRGNVDESMLDLLESLETLVEKDSVIMESLKSAYCWTAVESTLRFMWPENACDGLFKDVLERIWRKRIGVLKEKESGLVSHELLKWEVDLEEAFVEPEMYRKIRESNVRYNAMSCLNQLVKEQCGLLKDPIRGRDSVSREDVNVGGGVENDDHESSAHNAKKTVARELKDWLMGIEGSVYPCSSKGNETNNVIDISVDVTPQTNQANRSKSRRGGGGQAEDKQLTLSSSSSPGRVRPYLPTPVPLNVQPLKTVKPAKKRFRRPVRFWTEEEVEVLRRGVKEYGKAWKAIKDANSVVLADRTEVDLKDKWRNLIGRH